VEIVEESIDRKATVVTRKIIITAWLSAMYDPTLMDKTIDTSVARIELPFYPDIE
jgi:hypothetical protein